MPERKRNGLYLANFQPHIISRSVTSSIAEKRDARYDEQLVASSPPYGQSSSQHLLVRSKQNPVSPHTTSRKLP